MSEYTSGEHPRVTEDGSGRTEVAVAPGRGEDLLRHLGDYGVAATLHPGAGCDRLEFGPDADRRAVQAVVDRWPG